MNTISIQKSDQLGAIFSALCLVHCVATPFLFIAKSTTAHACSAAPAWWAAIDYIFLVLSFTAVWASARATRLSWIPYAMWTGWSALALVIVCERWHLAHLPSAIQHIPALLLITLHIYNLRHCQCAKDECCSTSVL